ncbi:hypothetical protein WA026_019325 [Henosepilachna vigintioctopunctata]|uniref:Uncharacterized protein n=1 Tax=Henosepilachna vigintioctopunctata TaxID=420089 RepID=A0AAW1UC67_9CUCU
MIVHVYLSILKRGNVTGTFSKKVVNSIVQDLNIPQFQLDAPACEQFYSIFGDGVDDTNIIAIAERWAGLLPPEALRLRLGVQQVARSEITALIVTGRDIKIFDDFNGDRLTEKLT